MSEAFEAALYALKAQLETETVEPLTGRYYEEAHQAFEAASQQRQLLGDWLDAKLRSSAASIPSGVSWLSIGCGAGHLDLPRLSRHRDSISDYIGLEPNPAHIERYSDHITEFPQAELIASTLEDWTGSQQFDLVTAIHVIYYAEDPDAFLRNALNACKPSGETVIAVAPLNAMNRIAEIFWSAQSVSAVFSEALGRKLEALRQQFEQHRIDTGIPLSVYREPLNDRRILDFTVQAKTDGLSDRAKEKLQNAICAAATGSGEAAYLEHRVDIFTIRGGNDTAQS